MGVVPGAPADPAGGEEEDDGDGRPRGEERRPVGSLQRPLCLPLQTGLLGSSPVITDKASSFEGH